MDYYSSISTIKYSEFGTALKTAHECVIAEICLLFCDLWAVHDLVQPFDSSSEFVFSTITVSLIIFLVKNG